MKEKKDIFSKQMTETLRIKGVKNMSDLVKHYKSITDAIDDQGVKVQSEDNSASRKNLTLKFKKRGKEFDELKKIWSDNGMELGKDFSQDESTPDSPAIINENPKANGIVLENQASDVSNIDEIKSDRDLARVLISFIEEAFFDAETGLWPKYDKEFDRQSYTSLGKPGWENHEQGDAQRELINRKKNEEVTRLMESNFVLDVIQKTFESIQLIVIGVKKKEVKHGVRNHVRFHLYSLIYGKK